jgi:hypothetical protein
MENFGFDVNDILSPEEAEKFFEEQENTEEETQETETEKEVEKEKPAEEQEESAPEKVGEEEETGKRAVGSDDGGSSPNLYSSIASALKKDGIFPDFSDEELAAVKTPDDFAELFEKAVSSRYDERMKRIDEALNNGVAPDSVKGYEQTIQYLDSVTDEKLSEEGEDGENLRRQLIYNDLVNRGYSQERAQRELEKSFKSGSDIEDAKDALAALKKFYSDSYENLRKEAKDRAEEARENQKRQAEDLKKMIMEDEIKLGDLKLDKKTRTRVYDAISKPVYKDKESGRLMTAIQQYQKEKPLEFLKQIGMWFVLTEGGKNLDGFVKPQVNAKKNESIRDLSRKINASSFNADGSLNYLSGGDGDTSEDILLSDDWKI